MEMRTYTKSELARIYFPMLDADLAMRKLRRWIKQNPALDEALSLLRLCEPGIIDKFRWLVPVGNHVFEVDEFMGDNAGLVVAEVELNSENESFERPDFLGQEVTGERKYYNSQLRRNPFKNWK